MSVPPIESSGSFAELLRISHDHPNVIAFWIEKNLDRERTLDEILISIGQNPRYFHFYFEYARQALSKWNSLPKELIPSLRYLFCNLTKLAQENVNVTDVVNGYGFDVIFANSDVLSGITNIPVAECDPEALVRFVQYYVRNYERNLLLRKHQDFIQSAIERLVLLKPSELQVIFGNAPEKLFGEVGFSLSKGYAILFEIIRPEGRSTYISNLEFSFIQRLPKELIIAEMEGMSMKVFSGFIDRIRRCSSQNMDYLVCFEGIGKLSSSKRFHLSLAYRTRIFSREEIGEFLAYCLVEIGREKTEMYGEYMFSDISGILDFFLREDISLFLNQELFIEMVRIISKNSHTTYALEKYLSSFKTTVLPSPIFARDVCVVLSCISERSFVPLCIFFAEQLLCGFSIVDYLDFMDFYSDKISMQSRTSKLSESLLSSIQKTSSWGYRTQERLLQHIITVDFLSKYLKVDYVQAYASGSGKMRYILMRNKSTWLFLIDSQYQMKSLREKCFTSIIFPVNLFHWIGYWLSSE